MTIGKRIKSQRIKKSLTQQQVADAVGTAVSYISEIERDLKTPGSKILVSLKHVFNVSIDWILTGEESPNRENHISDSDSQAQPANIIESGHFAIVKRFVDKSYARDLNLNLVELERMSPVAYRKVGAYIKGVTDGVRIAAGNEGGNLIPDRRIAERRSSSDPRLSPEGNDRRSGKDRRKAG